ncbi:MAG: hypothetical protein KDD45_09915 [Bdellovibrionales bacterium]|nr:hypothetical protein [Bdellovibrionales bacterium]
MKKALKGEAINHSLLSRSLHKTFLPGLHAKTYFKSVSTLFTEIPNPARKKELVFQVDEPRDDPDG